MPNPGPWHWLRWVAGAAALLAVVVFGGAFVYIHFISGPAKAPLALPSGTAASPGPAGSGSPAAAGTPVTGSWRVGAGSLAGYRVLEVLAGQNNVAVGRSSAVTGQLTIAGTVVTGASFSVRIATIHSNESQRDAQFDGRIMNAAQFPVGTFTLTRPIQLAPVPAPGVIRHYAATGKLTLHGHSKLVTFPVSAERTGAELQVAGSIPVVFAGYDIPDPSFAGFVTVQNHGVLEFLLKFRKS